MIGYKDLFFSDIRSIIRKPQSLLVLAVLAIMPGFYAWFNISASWNPYGNTSHIPIAVSNDDTGTTLGGIPLQVGNAVVQNLAENHHLWWHFVDAQTAAHGVYMGKYYASIHIPENFSHELTSFLSDHPNKPTLVYTVNEKLNAIAPNITKKWVEAIRDAIESNFISALNAEVFKKMNGIAEKIQQQEAAIHRARELINMLIPKLWPARDTMQSLQEGMHRAWEATHAILSILPELEEVLGRIESASHIPLITPQDIAALESLLLQGGRTIRTLVSAWVFSVSQIHATVHESGQQWIPHIESAQNRLLRANHFLLFSERILLRLQWLFGWSRLQKMISANQALQNRTGHLIRLTGRALHVISRWEALSETLLSELMGAANSLEGALSTWEHTLQSEMVPFLTEGAEYIHQSQKEIGMQVASLRTSIPHITETIHTVQSGLQSGNLLLDSLLSHWDEIHTTLTRMQSVLNTLSPERIQDILTLMLLNPESEENFFQHPVNIDMNTLFPSPNYGSSIAPFFTVLALWVWALLSVSLLSVRSGQALQVGVPRRWYLVRLSFFLIMGCIQASIIIAGNHFFFHVHMTDPMMVWISSLLIISLFQVIVFSLVSLLGNAGKVVAILVLLLQLSAGSGTFPVELTNDFFMAVHPFLPFTYAINLLREYSFGMIAGVVLFQVFILLLMMALTLLVSLVLIPRLSRMAQKMDARTEGIDLFV